LFVVGLKDVGEIWGNGSEIDVGVVRDEEEVEVDDG
jgi:hypothetical protein